MGTFRITHTRKDGADADRRIDAVMVEGRVYPIDDIINWIRRREHSFYVQVWGRTVNVLAQIHPTSRRWFLTTEGDGFPPNNLLSLPPC